MMNQFSVRTKILNQLIELSSKAFSFISDIFKIIGWLLIVGLIYYFHLEFKHIDNNFYYLFLILYIMCAVAFGCIIIKTCFPLCKKVFRLIRLRIYSPSLENLLVIFTTIVMISSIFYFVDLLFMEHSISIIKAAVDNHFLAFHSKQG